MASLRQFYQRLRADCETVAATVRQQSLATPEELADQKPGGESNPDTGPDGWLSFYRFLHRKHAIASAGESPGARPLQGHAENGVALDTLRGRPERLDLLDPAGDVEFLTIYPKSFVALVTCHELNLRLGYLSAHLQRARDAEDVGGLELASQAWERTTRYLRRLVWIVTSEGPRLPYDPIATPEPEAPSWIDALSPLDLHRVVQVYQQVNAVRLVALEKLVAPDPDSGPPTRPSWSIFFPGAAAELGIREAELMEDHDLPGVVARQRLLASGKRQAQQDAEKRAERKRGGRSDPTPGAFGGRR